MKRAQQLRDSFRWLGADDEDVRWLGAPASLLRRQSALPQPSLTRSPSRGRCSSTCPWRRCRTAGNGLKTIPQQTKHCATWLPCASVRAPCCAACPDISNTAHCAGRFVREPCNVIVPSIGWPRSKAQFACRSSNCTAPPAAAKPPTTVKQMHRGRQMPHPTGTRAKHLILEYDALRRLR